MPTSSDGSTVSAPSAIASETFLAPPRPEFSESIDLWTFQDAYNHLQNIFDFKSSSIGKNRAIQSIVDAYRDLPNAHSWSFLKRRGQVRTVAVQSTGTIAFDLTGGTYERMVTLSGATWPSDVRYYRILISGVSYKVAERKSSTIITLTEDSHPGADIAASTTYKLSRSTYPFPADYRRGTRPVSLNNASWPEYLSVDASAAMLEGDQVPQSDPDFYTITGTHDSYGHLSIEFIPPPSAAKTYDFVYDARMRPVKSFGSEPQYSTGTISISSGTTVAGSGTSFDSRMVGCVIRFTNSATVVPSGRFGVGGSYEPFSEQRIVLAVSGATSLTIDRELDSTYSSKKYSIGDPVDMEQGVMLTAFQRLCEKNYVQYSGKTELIPVHSAMYESELEKAAYADIRSRDVQSGQKGIGFPSGGLKWGSVEVNPS